MNKSYSLVSFHNHDSYSYADSILDTKEYVNQAKMLNAKSIGISNHGNLSSWLEFSEHCKKNDIKPIAGVEFYLHLSDDPKSKKSYHTLVIAKNEIGFRNILKLLHISNTKEFFTRPRISEKTLFAHKNGLAVGNACISSPVTHHLLKGDEVTARIIAQEFKNEFGHNYFFELMPHANKLQASVNKKLIELAKDLDIEIAVTLDTHFKDKSYEEVYLINGRNRRGITQSMIENNPPEDCLLEADFYFKDCDCIIDTLIDHGLDRKDIIKAMDYTVQLDKEINFEYKDKFDLPTFSENPNKDLEKLLGKNLIEKFGTKDGIPQVYKERLRYEYNVTRDKNFSSYFLLLEDLISYAKNNGIKIGPGRGSAGGSLIAYILGLTEVDPVFYNLPFERFQNPARSSALDIDTDVSPGDRMKLISYLKTKYGDDNVVQIITFGEVKAKAAIKEVAKYMEIPFAEVNAVCASIPSLHYDDEGALVDVELAEALEIPEVATYKRKYPKLFELALKMEHSYKSASCHAGGVVVTPKPVYEIAPTALKKGDDDILMIGFDKKGCEKIGLTKIDLLGLQTLDVLAECEKLTGIKTSEIKFDDEKTWNFLSDAKFCNGIFQLGENQTKRYLREVRPNNIIDLAILNSALRPGSDYSTFIKNRKDGVVKPEVDLPIIRETLKDSMGSIIFQDDLMFLISNLSEMNLGEADLMRRALEKNDKEKIEEFKAKFVETNKYPESALEIFKWLQSKVGYAFAKSHSVAYSIVGYWTCWYKVHFGSQFLVANIKNPKSNGKFTESEYIGEFIDEARKMGIKIKLPAVGKCENGPFYDAKENCVYLGLSSLKGITEKPAEVIIEASKLNDGAPNLQEFCDFCFAYKLESDRENKKGEKIKRAVVTKAHLRTLLNIGFLGGDFAENIALYNKLYKEDLPVYIDAEDAANSSLGFDYFSPYDKFLKQLPEKYHNEDRYMIAKVAETKSGNKNGRSWNLLKLDTRSGQVSAFVDGFRGLAKGQYILLDYEKSKKGQDTIKIREWKVL